VLEHVAQAQVVAQVAADRVCDGLDARRRELLPQRHTRCCLPGPTWWRVSAATPRAGTGQRKSCESTSCAAVRLSASRAMAMQAAARIMALFCRGALQALRRRVQSFRRVCAPKRTGSARCTRSQPVLGPVAKTLHSPEEEAKNRSSSISDRYKIAAG